MSDAALSLLERLTVSSGTIVNKVRGNYVINFTINPQKHHKSIGEVTFTAPESCGAQIRVRRPPALVRSPAPRTVLPVHWWAQTSVTCIRLRPPPRCPQVSHRSRAVMRVLIMAGGSSFLPESSVANPPEGIEVESRGKWRILKCARSWSIFLKSSFSELGRTRDVCHVVTVRQR